MNFYTFCLKSLQSFILASVAILLSACSIIDSADREEDQLEFHQLTITNQSSVEIEDLTLRVIKTGKIFSCNIITRDGFCALEFKKRNYEGNLVVLRWKQHGLTYEKEIKSIEFKPRSNLSPDKVDLLEEGLEIKIKIWDNGITEYYLKE